MAASKKQVIAGGGIAAMLAIAIPFGQSWEGRSLDPYKDIVGVWTVCDGATHVPMRRYSNAECDAISADQYRSFGEAVAKSTPGIDKEPWQWAAFTVFASNVGVGAYNRSSVRSLYAEGRYVEACRFIRNYKYAGGKIVNGLVYRREGRDTRIGEYELCLAGAVPAALTA